MGMNSLFTRRMVRPGPSFKVQEYQNRLVDASPATYLPGKFGNLLSSLFFPELCEPRSSPGEGCIDMDVQAVSIHANDVYTMSDCVDTEQNSRALDLSGIFRAVGPNAGFRIGDSVVALAPTH
jgi:hypothetical protein